MSLEADPPRDGAGQGPGPRPRAVFRVDLRHALRARAAGAGGSRGTTSRSTSRSRTARSSRPPPPSSARTPARSARAPRKGLRTLADLEDRALRLLQALDDDQKKVAVIAEEAPKEIRAADFKSAEGGGLGPKAPDDPAEGIAFAKLNDDQQPRLLRALIETYAAEMPPRSATPGSPRSTRPAPEASTSPGRAPTTAPSPTPTRSRAPPSSSSSTTPRTTPTTSTRLAEHARRLRDEELKRPSRVKRRSPPSPTLARCSQ